MIPPKLPARRGRRRRAAAVFRLAPGEAGPYRGAVVRSSDPTSRGPAIRLRLPGPGPAAGRPGFRAGPWQLTPAARAAASPDRTAAAGLARDSECPAAPPLAA
eukprot:181032-Hanusia_phi.AAC.1